MKRLNAPKKLNNFVKKLITQGFNKDLTVRIE